MKRVNTLVLAIALLLSLAACGTTASNEKSTEPAAKGAIPFDNEQLCV